MAVKIVHKQVRSGKWGWEPAVIPDPAPFPGTLSLFGAVPLKLKGKGKFSQCCAGYSKGIPACRFQHKIGLG